MSSRHGTPANSTLYVKHMPREVPLAELELLFGKDRRFSGFVRLRKVRGTMAFVDYQNVDQASRALERLDGYRFEHLPDHPGLLVDYDKDDTDKKVARYTIKRKREEEVKNQYKCCCKHCGTVCIKLNVSLHSLPKRKTDGAYCLVLAKHTCLVDVGKGEQKAVKRDGGAERQWRLTCLGCDLWVGYQSVPWTEPSVKVVYLLSDALVEEAPQADSKRRRAEAAKSSDDTSGKATGDTEPPAQKPVLDSTVVHAPSKEEEGQ